MIAFIENENSFPDIVQSIILENKEISNAIDFLDKKIKENSTGSFTDEEIEC